ncbi:hypothetical protein [Salipiger sp.]|uniref:aspartate racemase/maleate isomerase family protein n=1 Tax=Salipiger sp. TaxID=2078585 RepID=UPI003A985FDE
MTNYAPDGLFGLLTPQANTTVEAEVRVLCPPGMLPLVARLISERATMDERLDEYVATLETTIARFSNAPLGAVALACTGMSYLVDPAEDRRRLDRIAAQRGYPVLTAAAAVGAALTALGARRVGIVSPYGDPLHGKALRYWEATGLDIVRTERLAGAERAFHPIYGLGGDSAQAALAAIGTDGLEAVVILGTGLPGLAALKGARAGAVPVLTPNLALMWLTDCTLRGRSADEASLRAWLDGTAWADRYNPAGAADARG